MAFRGFPTSFGPPSPLGTMKSPTLRTRKPAVPKPRPASYHGYLRTEDLTAIDTPTAETESKPQTVSRQHRKNDQAKIHPEVRIEEADDELKASQDFKDSKKGRVDESNEEQSTSVPETHTKALSCDGTGGQQDLQENETILYDQFDDKRIEAKYVADKQTSNNERDNAKNLEKTEEKAFESVEGRPRTLNLESDKGPSTYRTEVTNFHQRSGSQSSPGDSFRLTPLPVDERREPPPPYEEPRREVQTNERAMATGPGITRVVIPDSAMPAEDNDSGRRLLYCHHCGYRVYTVVTKDFGMITHVIAFIFVLLCLLPLLIVIYCTDFFKYKHHYCPNCNRIIGHEAPMSCKKIFYVK